MFVLKRSLRIVTSLEVLSFLEQATNILKTIKILLLMVQFHNAPSNFANVASRETGISYLFQKNGKRNLFSQNWSDNDARKKKIGYKISTTFFICTCRRQDDQNWYS